MDFFHEDVLKGIIVLINIRFAAEITGQNACPQIKNETERLVGAVSSSDSFLMLTIDFVLAMTDNHLSIQDVAGESS